MKKLVAVFLLSLLSAYAAVANQDEALEYYISGYDLQSVGKDELALEHYLKAYSLYGLSEPKISAEILVNIGLIFFNVQSYAKAIEFYELANKIYEPIKTYTYLNLGLAYSHEGKYEEALNYFEKNLELARQSHNEHQISKTYLEMGIVSFEAEDYVQARSYAEEVKERTTGDSTQLKLYAASINNIANSFFAEKKYVEAKMRLLECLSEFNSRNIPYFKGHTLNNLGGTYKGLGQIDSARYFFTRALNENQQAEDIDETQISLSELAELYESLGEKDSALLYTRKLVDLFKSNSYRQIAFDKKAIGLRLETIQAKHLLAEEKAKDDDWIMTTVLVAITSALFAFGIIGILWRRSKQSRR